MSCCCDKILDLCSVGTCATDTISLGINAKLVGEHIFKLEFLNEEFFIRKTFAIGEEIKFPTGNLNESYEFTAHLYEPNGAKVVIEKDGVNYDCVRFQTKIQYDAS